MADEPGPAPGKALGKCLGPVGASARLVGGALLIASTAGYFSDHSRASTLATLVLVFAATVAFYAALYWAAGERLARLDPWPRTVLFLAPLWVRQLGALPASVRQGLGLYIGVGLLVTVAIRYGGCEVVAIPSALLRRRYVVYCPYNVIDAAERPLGQGRGPLLRTVSLVLASYDGKLHPGGSFTAGRRSDICRS
jgi:hypothetical protein